MSEVSVRVRRLDDGARMPEHATEGSACFDLHALEFSIVEAGTTAAVRTGLAVEVPVGYAMFVFSRSGHAIKANVGLGNGVGVIDSDYRGEVKVLVRNSGKSDFVIHAGDRVAQAMVLPIPKVMLKECDELSDTDRSAGGFGSTGR